MSKPNDTDRNDRTANANAGKPDSAKAKSDVSAHPKRNDGINVDVDDVSQEAGRGRSSTSPLSGGSKGDDEPNRGSFADEPLDASEVSERGRHESHGEQKKDKQGGRSGNH